MLNWLSNSIFLHKRFIKSRSRSPKDCVHRGLGQRLNKQKTIRSVEGEWMIFCICIYRCIACYYCKGYENGPLFHFFTSRKQCLWRAICEKRSFLLRQTWAFSACWEASQALWSTSSLWAAHLTVLYFCLKIHSVSLLGTATFYVPDNIFWNIRAMNLIFMIRQQSDSAAFLCWHSGYIPGWS